MKTGTPNSNSARRRPTVPLQVRIRHQLLVVMAQTLARLGFNFVSVDLASPVHILARRLRADRPLTIGVVLDVPTSKPSTDLLAYCESIGCDRVLLLTVTITQINLRVVNIDHQRPRQHCLSS